MDSLQDARSALLPWRESGGLLTWNARVSNSFPAGVVGQSVVSIAATQIQGKF